MLTALAIAGLIALAGFVIRNYPLPVSRHLISVVELALTFRMPDEAAADVRDEVITHLQERLARRLIARSSSTIVWETFIETVNQLAYSRGLRRHYRSNHEAESVQARPSVRDRVQSVGRGTRRYVQIWGYLDTATQLLVVFPGFVLLGGYAVRARPSETANEWLFSISIALAFILGAIVLGRNIRDRRSESADAVAMAKWRLPSVGFTFAFTVYFGVMSESTLSGEFLNAHIPYSRIVMSAIPIAGYPAFRWVTLAWSDDEEEESTASA